MNSKHTQAIDHSQNGFTLVEIAMVLLIVALLLAGIVPTISSQIDQRNVSETRRQLDEIQQALIGYAVVNGRLPCPASSTSNGIESPVGGGNCSNFYNGFVPATTLGLTGANGQGLVVDAWGNPIRYAASSWSKTTAPAVNNVFTSANGMSTVGMANLAPNLLVCSTASTSSSGCSVANSSLTPNGIPAVIYSIGKNGGYGGTGLDEASNPNPNSTNNNPVFVSHLPAPVGATNGEFDDIVIWLSTNTLVNRLVVAGQLP